MLDRRNIKIHFRRLLLLVRALRTVALIPFIILNIVIPLLLLFIFLRKGAGEELQLTTNRLYGLFLPFMLCWCSIFVQKFYFEEPGCELLFVNSTKGKTTDMVLLFFLGIGLELLLLMPLFILVQGFRQYCFGLFPVSLFYFGFSYLLSFAFRSITPTLLVSVVYTLLNLISPLQTVHFPFYYSPESQTDFLRCEFPLALTGIAAVAVTSLMMLKRRKV